MQTRPAAVTALACSEAGVHAVVSARLMMRLLSRCVHLRPLTSLRMCLQLTLLSLVAHNHGCVVAPQRAEDNARVARAETRKLREACTSLQRQLNDARSRLLESASDAQRAVDEALAADAAAAAHESSAARERQSTASLHDQIRALSRDRDSLKRRLATAEAGAAQAVTANAELAEAQRQVEAAKHRAATLQDIVQKLKVRAQAVVPALYCMLL